MILGAMFAFLALCIFLGVTGTAEGNVKKKGKDYRSDIRNAREKRAKAIAEVRKIVDTADTEKRELRAEDNEKVDKYEKDIEDLDKRIAALETASREDEDDDEDEEREEDGKSEKKDDEDEDEDEDEERSIRIINGKRYMPVSKRNKIGAQQRDPNTGKLVRHAGESTEDFAKRQRRSKAEYTAAFLSYVTQGERGLIAHMGEKRAVQADTDYNGGFLVMPQQFVQTLIKATDNILWIRKLATKFQVQSAQSLGAPTLDTDPDDSDWTSELATGNEDNSFAFGKRELMPYPLAKRLKVSNKLLRMAAVSNVFTVYNSEEAGKGTGPIESFLISRLAYKNAVPQEKAFMTGDGIAKPLGLFTASSRGISTARDVSAGSNSAITADALIATKYNQKMQYHATSKWLFSRTAIKQIRQLKDSYGQYLWLPGLQQGQPDRLLDHEVMMSEYCPSTFTSGAYVGMFGDFSFYWIVDSLEYQIQKLVELYAEANQTGFISRAELDGMPVLEEAFSRIKLD